MDPIPIDQLREFVNTAEGNFVQIDLAGIGSYVGWWSNGNNLYPNSKWVVDGFYLCSDTNQIIPVSLINEISLSTLSLRPAAKFTLNDMMSSLNVTNTNRPAFLDNEIHSQLHASGNRVRYVLQDSIPEELKRKHRFPTIDTTGYTHFGIESLKTGFSDSLRMPTPTGLQPASGAVHMPTLRGEQFFNSPPRFSGPVRLYSDIEYLRANVPVQKVTGGGVSFPLIGGGSISRLTTLELKRYYRAIGKLPLTTLSQTGAELDVDYRLQGYTSFPPHVCEENGRIVITNFEPAWKIEWSELEGRKYATGVFHTRNVASKDELRVSEWTHLLIDPNNVMVTLDSFFSNSQRIELVATHKNEIIKTRFGESNSYLVMRYAEYHPDVEQE